MESLYYDDGAQGHTAKKIIASVVSLAVRDACAKPIRGTDAKGFQLQFMAFGALDFLFAKAGPCDAYLRLLGNDPEVFKKKILTYMHARLKTPKATEWELNDEQRRYFRLNLQVFNQMDEDAKHRLRQIYMADLYKDSHVLAKKQERA